MSDVTEQLAYLQSFIESQIDNLKWADDILGVRILKMILNRVKEIRKTQA